MGFLWGQPIAAPTDRLRTNYFLAFRQHALSQHEASVQQPFAAAKALADNASINVRPIRAEVNFFISILLFENSTAFDPRGTNAGFLDQENSDTNMQIGLRWNEVG